MNKLKELLNNKQMTLFAGVHDATSACIAQECGFDALWLSGFGLSATCGVPDANSLSPKEISWLAQYIYDSTEKPILLDGDSGYGDFHSIINIVETFEKIGVQGISLEDKSFPKKNSFLDVNHTMLSVEEFSRNIYAACNARKNDDFLIVARTEEIIAGGTLERALWRCEEYAKHGADAIIIHSKEDSPRLVLEFVSNWKLNIPVIVIPTTYPQLTVTQATASGISGIIYANQGIRASAYAMKKIFKQILNDGTAKNIQNQIASISDIYKIQKMDKYIEDESKYQTYLS